MNNIPCPHRGKQIHPEDTIVLQVLEAATHASVQNLKFTKEKVNTRASGTFSIFGTEREFEMTWDALGHLISFRQGVKS
jgi:hypothetical protein